MAVDPVVAIYPVALPRVYGYLLPRCGSATLAEDLTAETFLAAVAASRQGSLPEVNVGWLVGVARHKLVDHWRRLEREQRSLVATEAMATAEADDPGTNGSTPRRPTPRLRSCHRLKEPP
jgi:RNA polymerase sigma-70 factor (ECF subfamily)